MEYRPSKRRSNRQAQITRWFCSKKGAISQEYFVYFKNRNEFLGKSNRKMPKMYLIDGYSQMPTVWAHYFTS